MRLFNALVMLKRSGQAHGIDEHLPMRPPGSVVVPCFACPEPGFNMSIDDQEIDEDFRYELFKILHHASLLTNIQVI